VLFDNFSVSRLFDLNALSQISLVESEIINDFKLLSSKAESQIVSSHDGNFTEVSHIHLNTSFQIDFTLSSPTTSGTTTSVPHSIT
jgi:hypothetical protein